VLENINKVKLVIIPIISIVTKALEINGSTLSFCALPLYSATYFTRALSNPNTTISWMMAAIMITIENSPKPSGPRYLATKGFWKKCNTKTTAELVNTHPTSKVNFFVVFVVVIVIFILNSFSIEIVIYFFSYNSSYS